MPKLVVACVQQQMRLFETQDGYRKELNRFLSIAHAKGAGLAAFPALTGIMAAAPLVEGFRVGLLKRADEGGRQATFLTRARGRIAGSTANLLRVSFRSAFAQVLAADALSLHAEYEGVFSDLAHAYSMTVVAGSAYLPDAGGTVRHRATVFGPDGSALGYHDKTVLSPQEEGLATAGGGWRPIPTPAGSLGLMLDEEATYPEVGRLLAHRGAELLLSLSATADPTLAAYIRQATIARAQENGVFSLASFLVGKNYLAQLNGVASDFSGKSGIYAPLEMTPRQSGVLVEMGTVSSEGLLTAELDTDEVHSPQQTAASLRTRMPVELFAVHLPEMYGGAAGGPAAPPAEQESAFAALESGAAQDAPSPPAGDRGAEAGDAPERAPDVPDAEEEDGGPTLTGGGW